jgi:hypothetical protein
MNSVRTRFFKALLALSLVFLIALPPQGWSWGNAGHEAVAYVAWQQLTPKTKARVMALLQQVPELTSPKGTKVPGFDDWVKDLPSGLTQDQKNQFLFMRAATWPDSIKHVGFHDSDEAPKGLTKDVNIGFTDTSSHGYWHFIDTGFASDSSTAPATPAPNAVTQIGAFRDAIASNESDPLKAYDLIWLEHMVGDLHQPLHATVRYFAGKGDEGGNTVMIKMPTAMKKSFEGTLSKSAPTELHAFWDDLPGEGAAGPAVTEAAAFGKPLPAAPSAKVADTNPADWAAESLAMAKSDVYVSPIGKGPTPGGAATAEAPAASGEVGAKAPATGSYLITTVYYNTALSDAKARIALAGARLAKLLNENLK